jgi:excisionase family DNA binding protein
MEKEIADALARLESKLEEQNLLKKDVLNFEEACSYMDLSKSHLYKLTSKRLIPHSKPRGKLVFFERKKLDEWRLSNPVMTFTEIDNKTSTYVTLNKS